MRREKQAFLVAIAAAALTMPALALAQDASGYFGLSTGATKAKEWCDTSALPPGASLASCDRRDKGWKMFAGYRVYRVLAFEASFIDFGKRSLTATLGPESTTVRARGSAFSADAVVMIPLGWLEVFGKVGIAKVKAQSADTTLSGTTFKLGKNDNEAHVGLGLNYRFSSEWDVRAEFERIRDSRIDFFSIGLQYRY
jgi:opacity protein-like surface antigen